VGAGAPAWRAGGHYSRLAGVSRVRGPVDARPPKRRALSARTTPPMLLNA